MIPGPELGWEATCLELKDSPRGSCLGMAGNGSALYNDIPVGTESLVGLPQRFSPGVIYTNFQDLSTSCKWKFVHEKP